MKNSKTTTYILLIIVMGLWVVVFYRIYKSFFSEDTTPVLSQTPVLKKKIALEENDVFNLKVNYPDPFLGKVYSPIKVSITVTGGGAKPKAIPKPKKEEVKIDWSFIKYVGLIKNHQSNKLVALVSINGKEHMVSEGDKINEVTFIKNYGDSIKVSYQGVSVYLKK